MNSMQIKDKLRNISNRENIDFNIVLRNYMYERFIERLANSKYKNNFIFKGGYLLSIVLGLNNRQTIDIDLSLKNEILTKDNIYKIICEIINIDVGDIAVLIVDDISEIRDDDEYGGYRVKITVKIENIRETFNIDIATGDIITPKEIIFNYKTMFDYRFIKLKSYNFETIVSEKIETILSKLEFNSRMKDYYDIYLIYNLAKKELDLKVLKNAIENTFKKRNFYGDIDKLFQILKDSDILRKRWKSYIKYNKYIENIDYDEIIDCLEKIIDGIKFVEI